MALSEQDREALVGYLSDLVTFNAGALTEATLGLRDFSVEGVAAEFAEARLPVEIEAIVARHVAEALDEAAEAIKARVARNIGGHPYSGHDHGLAEAARIVRSRKP